ncbi:ABC transporter permease [Acidiferrimicrobium sp. IK]|uniref:ABC transporter permease n=1 Tax=Acidiferrimicrobium sp. IK TaxID=2871700 RepID=UPI0021CB367E|nr:ABC transporter permease [Acidiferrimicrobium sp. IK]MCU4186751.1 ABC transporter permease [Acidiferrimicrobium sp. IK]
MAKTEKSRYGESFLRRFGVVIVWAVVVVAFSAAKPHTFPTTSNFTTLFASQAPLGVLALALVIPLSAGDYDLSVASVLSFSSMLVAVLNTQHGIPVGLAAVLGVAFGATVGLANGLICVLADIDPFIVTLGVGTFLDGLTLWISKSAPVSGVSEHLVNLVVVHRFLGLSLEFWYLLVLAVVVWYFFEFTPTGRRVLIVGRGREVARLSGLRVKRIRILSFVSAGALSGLAGVVYVGTSGSADPSAGTSLLLPAFAAVFLGATTIAPGRFNPWGTMVAVYFLTTGINGLAQLGVSTFVEQLFYGGALVIAVLLSSLVGRPSMRKARAAADTAGSSAGPGGGPPVGAEPSTVAPSS